MKMFHFKPGIVALFLIISPPPTHANLSSLRRLAATKRPTKPPTTRAPTNVPTNPPTTRAPTNVPTNPPTTRAPTNVPTNPPTTQAPTNVPTNAPTNPPTTRAPTNVPTNPPTTRAPTNVPTNLPTTQAPTNVPTNVPTNSPTTRAPTNFPTNPPTTLAPTNVPTNSPVTTAPPQAPVPIDCPQVGNQLDVGIGSVKVRRSSINMICGIYIKAGSSLIPFARSYDSHEWEAAPGPLASPSSGIACLSDSCTIQLPALENVDHKYVLLTKDGNTTNQEQIARFLEFTTFGPKMSEVDELDDGSWDEVSRAQHLKTQMSLNATSHREYYRKRTNSKWDASTQPAKSNDPCSPLSKWRKYTYIYQDRYHTIDGTNVPTRFEVVPSEVNFTTTIYEVDSRSDASCGSCDFKNSSTATNTGYSGKGYYDFGGTNDFISWNVTLQEGGIHPISFRFAQASASYNGNRKCELYVNNAFVVQLDFMFTISWSYWKYTDLVNVNLTAGLNTIKLKVAAQNGGPNIDHLRLGKPPAVVLKTNGWPRTVAVNGVNLLDEWYPGLINGSSVTFPSYPDPPQGDLYRYPHGRTRIALPGRSRYLDIGNPPIEFNGYEQYLPKYYFNFTSQDVFLSTASNLYSYPLQEGQELILKDGISHPYCDLIPQFAEEFDAPVFGKLPSGEWLQFSPTIALNDNGPSVNDLSGDSSSNVLPDGGGATYVQTDQTVKCSNVPRSIFNEDTCFLSKESTACSSHTSLGEIEIQMNTSTVKTFYELSERYVYAVRGLVMEKVDEHPCAKTKSRWSIQAGTTCVNPTSLGSNTLAALQGAISSSSDKNSYVRDVSRQLTCDSGDITVGKLNIVLQIGSDCFTHVHPDLYSVYDFSGWVTNHPGGEYNIMKWAQGWEGVEGWYLDFPYEGNTTRKIPKHPMTRWDTYKGPPYIEYITRLGDTILYRDLSNSLKTDAIAEHFGATSRQVLEGGVIVCGSIGEVSNDPSFHEVYDVRSNKLAVTSSDVLNNQKQVIWTEIAMGSRDQLRQRVAWALAQIITVVPGNIDAYDRTEAYAIYYDIFVRHAFGNFRDILSEVSYSPLMAEHLSYLKSKSHAYVYSSENKRVSSADENFAREVMQLFTIGLVMLNSDGTSILDSNGMPVPVYTNGDIESFARAWTGFDRTASRGNIEEVFSGSTSNRVDPMQIIPSYRDAFPKSGLGSTFIGDGYVLCKDLPSRGFLKRGARYRLLGGNSSPELMKDPSYFSQDATYNITRATLDSSSQLYQRLANGGNYEMNVKLENDLVCTGIECKVDTLRVVKVNSVYFEYVEQPCVQLAFYNGGKQIQLYDNYRQGQMCANPSLPHARAACCREERYQEVRYATLELGVGYFYDGERTTYSTAKDRCSNKGLCVYEAISVSPDNWFRKGYHWTNKDCAMNVKINREGYIAIVHDVDSSNINTVPYHVEEKNTLNWFRVFWDGAGEYPGFSETNDCASNHCKVLDDGTCLCKATVTETVVFDNIEGISKRDIISNLFIGCLGPTEGSTIVSGNGFTAYLVGSAVDGTTVFEVEDKGRIIFLKNLRSTVHLQGWETLPPQIHEAESATLYNVTVMSDSTSASGNYYVDYGNNQSYIEWDVNVNTSGQYLVSFRYALDSYPQPLSLIVNGVHVTRNAANPTVTVTYYGSTPTADKIPLARCAGDCDDDNECQGGLICHQKNGLSTDEVPGCSGYTKDSTDYCVDPKDYTHGVLFMPTGGWSDDWLQTQKIEITLASGVNNKIRLQIPTGYFAGPNIDYMKIESVTSAVSSMSFRNPPHFMNFITDYSPYGVGEQNNRDAEYETAAVLDHYFYQDNVAPFLCIRLMQRFGISNPSPRYVKECTQAFRTGHYESGSNVFGDDKYGCLGSTLAAILLDREATSSSLSMEPSHGALKEPILQVLNLLRSMDYQTAIPDTLDGPPMGNNYHVRLWKIDKRIGQGPYDFPSVFSFFLPEYIPDSGPVLEASLVSPESMLLTMPNTISLLNGMFSLIKYGLSDCNDGFSTSPGYSTCSDNGFFQRSFGHLAYTPHGATIGEYISDISLLLTAGRLSDENRAIIEQECSAQPDNASITRCIQQLVVSTGEFHSTSRVTSSGKGRAGEVGGGGGTNPYKVIVYFYLGGGCDSFNLLTPYNCAGDPGDTVYDRYRSIRGKSEIAEGVGLPLNRLHEIQANNAAQPCTTFGIHGNLTVLKTLYDQGEVNFVANAGLLAKPVDVSNYSGETPAQLFAHNAMTLEAAREDLADNFSGTGVGGRIADVLTKKGVKTNTFSISGQQILLSGEPGVGPSQFILSSSGLSAFNANPSIPSMNDVIKALNNATTADSGFFAEMWSSKLTEAIDKQSILKAQVDGTTVTTAFPDSDIGNQLKLVTRMMQTALARGVSRDVFYVTDGGYDTHSDVDLNLVNNFGRINAALEAFVNELKVLNLWDSTVLIQFSEFARTLDPNTGEGTDHGWGGNHFMMGGSVNGGKVLGKYPDDFQQHGGNLYALSRGRMIPTSPWDAMWKGTAEWFGISEGAEMDKVLPMHKNFPLNMLYGKSELFVEPAAGGASGGDSLFV